MADRYYICAMVGNGDADAAMPWTATTGPYRPSLADIPKTNEQGQKLHQVKYVGEIGKYAVVNVSSLDFTLVDAWQGASGDYPLSDSLLDVSLDADMSQAHKSFFGNLLKKWLGLSNAEANNVVNQTTTYRQAFDYLIGELKPGFKIDQLRAKGI